MSAASSFYTVYAVMFVIYHTSASHSSLTYLRLHGTRRWSDSSASRFGHLQPQNVAQKPRPKSSKFPWSWFLVLEIAIGTLDFFRFETLTSSKT